METRQTGKQPPVKRRVQVKLCGLRRKEDIRIVNEVLPEYAGFILAEGRRRTVTPEKMKALTGSLDRRIRRVAVFLNQDPEWICRLAQEDLMDVIQLHGSESDDMIRMIRKRTGKTVIKVLRTDRKPEETEAAARACPADLILLDHGTGGSGETFDWSLTGMIHRDFIMAGGLNPENVREAIDRTHPVAVDVSSGVETGGVKDAVKVRMFIRNVRGAGFCSRFRV